MSKLVFEEKGEEILRKKGIRKAEFARRMGIRKQNVKALFKTKNLDTIFRAAKVMDVPFEMLIGYTEEPDLSMYD
ncbi:MAG: helix-turn-helix domain-containing protein [Bacteroidales bacterium]|nr:helix-turn-helix domain-containing protein [Bacteroidales bacterium]